MKDYFIERQRLSWSGLYLLFLCWMLLLPANCFALEKGKIGQGMWETDYYVLEGEAVGPVIIIVGGIHGDEPAGWQAAKRLLTSRINRGKVIIIPQANAQAVRDKTREFIDGQDLNRCFPGKTSGTPMERLAFTLFNFIRENRAELVIDLHESIAFHQKAKEFLGQTIIAYQNEKSIWVGMMVVDGMNQDITAEEEFFLLHYPPRGSLNWATGKYLKTVSLTVETCSQLGLVQRIYYQLQAISLILAEWGVTLTW